MSETHDVQRSIYLDNYCLGKTIGRGTFGKVKKATHRITSQPVAIKILEKDKIKDITDVERVMRQLHILKFVRHSSIAQLYEIIQTSTMIFMVMQYASDGQFFDYIMDAKIKSEQEAFKYFMQILNGLDYLHQNKIAHRDVKPENILLDVHDKIKIVDFGLSNMYKDKQKLETACGSPCYASPEMIKGQQYNPQRTDVWSLGVVLYTMVFAKLPFEDDNTSILYSKIKAGLYIIDKKVSNELKNLLKGMLTVQPDKRLSIKQIKQHAWCKNKNMILTHGINIGFQKIPIDQRIVNGMVQIMAKLDLKIEVHQLIRELQSNIRNAATATYYLLLKKNFKNGIPSQNDICNEKFDQLKLNVIKTKRIRHKSFDLSVLYEKKNKNQHSNQKDLKSFNKNILHTKTKSLSRSVQYPVQQSCKSISKPKSKQRIKINLTASKQKQHKKRFKTQINPYVNVYSFYNSLKRKQSSPNKLKILEEEKVKVQKAKDKYNEVWNQAFKRQGIQRKNKQTKRSTQYTNMFWKKKSYDHSQTKDTKKDRYYRYK